MAINTWYHSSHQPTRLAHLNNDDQTGFLIEGDERAAQVIYLGHGSLHLASSGDDDAKPSSHVP
jgi:hypothetical protein